MDMCRSATYDFLLLIICGGGPLVQGVLGYDFLLTFYSNYGSISCRF